MNYNELKKNLLKTTLDVEKTPASVFQKEGYDINDIKLDLIQYMVFFEELEKKEKDEKTVSKKDFLKQFNIINKYIKEVNRILLK